MELCFKGKVVLVTGATRGIGNRIANDLLNAGAHVIATGTNDMSLKLLSSDFEKICVDFLDKNSTNNFLKKIEKKKIDICINNAGINSIANISEINLVNWDDIINVNLTVPFKILKAICKNMKNKKYGRVVNIASIWGVVGKEKRAAYSSSKFGIVGLTVSTAAELAKYNILVNSVSPGFTLTDLTKRILSQTEMDKIVKTIPIGRMAKPRDISSVVLFMCSDLNSYISGQNIVVDGGFTSV